VESYGEAGGETMRHPDQVSFYHTAAWLKCRDAYISSVGGMCERCAEKGIARPGYIVHHKEYINPDNIKDPAVLLSFDNLEYLCLDCHNEEHYGTGGNKRYFVDENGKIIIKA
jgi:hypothetical protein